MPSPNVLPQLDGTMVTHDGTVDGTPIMVFRGTRQGLAPSRVAPVWLTSSRNNAQFYEDGEIQNCYVMLRNPKVITSEVFAASRHGPTTAMTEAMREVSSGEATWDGIIFEDIVDGADPSTIYCVFPGSSARIHLVGRTTYEQGTGEPVFEGLQPSDDPLTYDRSDLGILDREWVPAAVQEHRSRC